MDCCFPRNVEVLFILKFERIEFQIGSHSENEVKYRLKFEAISYSVFLSQNQFEIHIDLSPDIQLAQCLDAMPLITICTMPRITMRVIPRHRGGHRECTRI